MGEFLIAVYELATVAVPGTVAIIVIRYRGLRSGLRFGTHHVAWSAVFFFYLFLVLRITDAGTVYDIAVFGFDPTRHNFVPAFWGEPLGFALNIALFVPFGALAAVLRDGKAPPSSALAAGAMLSALIEVSQLFNYRVTDINDIVANTCGALLGCIACSAMKGKEGLFARREADPSRSAALLYAAIAFAGRFLLFDELGARSALLGS